MERADWDDGAESLLRRSLGLDDAHLEEELRRFHTLVEQGEDARAADVLRQLVPRHEAYPDLHFLLRQGSSCTSGTGTMRSWRSGVRSS